LIKAGGDYFRSSLEVAGLFGQALADRTPVPWPATVCGTRK